jgi:hypothetical protein
LRLAVDDGTAILEISALLESSSSPRTGINAEHVQLLAGLPEGTPPILVQRTTMRVIDGMHRLHAARLRGDDVIRVVYFDGDDGEAFVEAVRLNAVHGLPLSAGERKAAVGRILTSHPQWSDRRIGAVCGVSPRTVAKTRKCSTDARVQTNNREGRDGRFRPVSAEATRKAACEYAREHPRATLREIARHSGVALGTAMDVRLKLRAEEAAETAPIQKRSSVVQEKAGPAVAGPVGPIGSRPRSMAGESRNPQTSIENLMRDPSLRYTDHGRALLRLMSATLSFIPLIEQTTGKVPDHCYPALSDAAQACAVGWQEVARLFQDVGEAVKVTPHQRLTNQ